MKINDVILRAAAKIVVFIILTFAVYLFFSGHDGPGGGFVGGLMLGSALVLLLLAFDIETITRGLPIDLKIVAAVGALIVVGTGAAALIFDKPFLNMSSFKLHLPIFNQVKISTMTLFEAGVALAVFGVVVTIITSISKDV
ncbi:Na(+)/H(+) antiporter subunit B [Aciduricibacillus chroicocephali]|uniref:Na(+)/H(+) antiporter subunit B n=1 Tax=Aciduricibacillus chroicocephali TaxID=3054939 RepID=A0ABY9KVP7_9BACI|nr:Na(+)/H(+) antiporter subunit B [Bacillaceae bacterium 44XB]